MPYKMSKDARNMFKSVIRDWDETSFTMWDFYYFCFSVGLSNKRLVSNVKLTDFSSVVDESYLPFQNELAAALVATEIERKGLDLSRENIITHFRELTESGSIFSQKGQELLNFYAEGGLQEIKGECSEISNPVDLILICKKVIGEDLPIKEEL